MQRCFELAKRSGGNNAPNPMVGSTIVYNNEEIIGEGFHANYGEFHAERAAIESVSPSKVHLLKESTIYVTLEPCAHFGNQPPCANAIIEAGIKTVICSVPDPNPLVSGKGFKILEENGIKVIQNVCLEEGKHLIRRFLCNFNQKRTYVVLKWAQTANGFIAPKPLKREQISDDLSKRIVHKWRSEEQAILVGYNTALIDNPSLDVRFWSGKSPIKVVLDRDCALPTDLRLFQQGTIVFCKKDKDIESKENIEYVVLEEWNEQTILKILYQRFKIQSVLIEGGAKTLQSFIDKNLWDEARIIESETTFEDGLSAPIIKKNNLKQEQLGNCTYKTIFSV